MQPSRSHDQRDPMLWIALIGSAAVWVCEALAFLATPQPPVTITGTKSVRYQAQSATLAHAHFVIEQVLGPVRPGDLIVTLRTR